MGTWRVGQMTGWHSWKCLQLLPGCLWYPSSVDIILWALLHLHCVQFELGRAVQASYRADTTVCTAGMHSAELFILLLRSGRVCTPLMQTWVYNWRLNKASRKLYSFLSCWVACAEVESRWELRPCFEHLLTCYLKAKCTGKAVEGRYCHVQCQVNKHVD